MQRHQLRAEAVWRAARRRLSAVRQPAWRGEGGLLIRDLRLRRMGMRRVAPAARAGAPVPTVLTCARRRARAAARCFTANASGRPDPSRTGARSTRSPISSRITATMPTPLVMKIDVEGAEWDSFLLAPDSVFMHIDQLDVEFHHVDDPQVRRHDAAIEAVLLHRSRALQQLQLRSGAPAVSIVGLRSTLVSKRIAVTDGAPAPPTPGLDAANNPSWPDCQAAAAGGPL